MICTASSNDVVSCHDTTDVSCFGTGFSCHVASCGFFALCVTRCSKGTARVHWRCAIEVCTNIVSMGDAFTGLPAQHGEASQPSSKKPVMRPRNCSVRCASQQCPLERAPYSMARIVSPSSLVLRHMHRSHNRTLSTYNTKLPKQSCAGTGHNPSTCPEYCASLKLHPCKTSRLRLLVL